MTFLYPYQKRVYRELQSLLDQHRIVLLAATTGFGKTELILKFIQDNPSKRFLILTHGQTNLRQNFYDRIMTVKSLQGSVLNAVTAKILVDADSCRILVGLPQTIHRNLSKLSRFDFLIVDEAHEYYIENMTSGSERVMYKNILRWHKGKEILLTASHYGFKRIPKVYFSREEALKLGSISDVQISIRESEFKILDRKMFGENGDLRRTVDVKNSINDIMPHLTAENFPLIIARHSQEAADQLARFLAKDPRFRGRFTVSHGANDPISANLQAFKRGEYPICIVVQRGSLGFDYPNMTAYLDATFTKSLTRVEQMIGRVSRNSKVGSLTKKFIKLAAKGREAHTNLLIVAVLALGEKNIYKTWNEFEADIPIKVDALRKSGIMRKKPSAKKRISKEPPIPGYLMKFSDYYGLSEKEHISFSEALALVKGIQGQKAVSQSKICEWALAGKPKPPKKDPMHTLMKTYLKPSQKCYEKWFADEIEEIAPHLFEKPRNNASINKKKLWQLALSGKPRPPYSSMLGERLYAYTTPRQGRYEYDAEWTAGMKRIAPKEWFMSQEELLEAAKNHVLQMARDGEEPPGKGSEYFSRYRGWLSPSSRSFDPKFIRNLHAANSSWLRFDLANYLKPKGKLARKGAARLKVKSKNPPRGGGEHTTRNVSFQ